MNYRRDQHSLIFGALLAGLLMSCQTAPVGPPAHSFARVWLQFLS